MTHPSTKNSFLARRGVLHASLAASVAALAAGCATPPAPAPAGLLTPAQKAVLRDLKFTEYPNDAWALDVGAHLGFDVDVAAVSAEDAATLARIARALLAVGLDHVTVEGHADSQGSEAYNLRLSERRAEAVAETLAANGFVLSNITRRGLGSSRPVRDNASAAGRLLNRRAVLIVPSF